MKYENLEQLRDAFAAGQLPEGAALTLDNDDTFLYVPEGPNPDEEWVEVFRGGTPQELLEEALDLLGIPHQGA